MCLGQTTIKRAKTEGTPKNLQHQDHTEIFRTNDRSNQTSRWYVECVSYCYSGGCTIVWNQLRQLDVGKSTIGDWVMEGPTTGKFEVAEPDLWLN